MYCSDCRAYAADPTRFTDGYCVACLPRYPFTPTEFARLFDYQQAIRAGLFTDNPTPVASVTTR